TGPYTESSILKLCPWSRAHLWPGGTRGRRWAASKRSSRKRRTFTGESVPRMSGARRAAGDAAYGPRRTGDDVSDRGGPRERGIQRETPPRKDAELERERERKMEHDAERDPDFEQAGAVDERPHAPRARARFAEVEEQRKDEGAALP